MKVRNILAGLFALGVIVLSETLSVSAHGYRDYYNDRPDYDMPNYTNFYGGNNYVCKSKEYPRFSFDSSDRVTSNGMYTTYQLEIATLGCRISKNNREQIAFYQREAENYLKFLKESRITAIWSIDGQRFDPRAIKRLYFLPQNGALIAEFEY
jgi:hypothetical protein